MLGRFGFGLMCKPPRAGLSKTRLAAAIGPERAAEFARAFLIDAAILVGQAAEEAGGTAYGVYRPAESAAEIATFLPKTIGLILSDAPDLGEAMFAALMRMLTDHPAGALVVGADLPTLPARVLVEAASRLQNDDVDAVFGPSADGGYYLVGVKGDAAAPLFAPMRWSTPDVMATTRERARQAGLRLAEVETWRDVDEVDDLVWLEAQLRSGRDDVGPARATRALMGL